MCVYTHIYIYIHIVSMESIEPPVRSTNPIRLKHLHNRGDGIATPAVEVELFAKEAGDG